MRSIKKIIFFGIFILATACKEKFVPQFKEQVTDFLVIEGYINSGTGPTTITLSRSTRLSDTASISKETKANVRVEGKTGTTVFPLTETTAGVYTNPQLTLIAGEQYRLRITTSKGNQYVSDYSEVRRTVDIDSVAWRQENGGVQIYANAHDAQSKTTYYMYKLDETWEYHTTFMSPIKLGLDAVGNLTLVSRPVADTIMYTCWQSATPFNILITSTEKLSQDAVSMFPVNFLAHSAWKLSVLYSINLKQYAMSLGAYRFYDQLRKNTQQLGSIFDAQPSEVGGNIHPVDSTSKETVIGFVEITEEKQKRIFISNKQLPGWNYTDGCELYVVKNPDSLGFQGNAQPIGPTSDPKHVYFAELGCVDCRIKGGVTKKPAFWP